MPHHLAKAGGTASRTGGEGFRMIDVQLLKEGRLTAYARKEVYMTAAE